MLRTVEAIIEPDGQVRLLEKVQLSEPRRALVTVLDEEFRQHGIRDEAYRKDITSVVDPRVDEAGASWSQMTDEP